MSLRRFGKSALINARWCLRGGPVSMLLEDNFPGPFDDLKCIFVHVPKSAGSSVSLSLFGHQTGHRRYVDYLRENRRKTAEYFKFAFVRNPWDRLVSAYHFLRAGGMTSRDQVWAQQHLAPYASFEEFVLRWVNDANVQRHRHFQPQCSYLVGYGSSDIKVDFIGRVENFDADFQTICARLGLRREPLRVNRSSHGDYRSCYTPVTADIVGRVYERDAILFGYRFDGVSSHAQIGQWNDAGRLQPPQGKDKRDEREAA